MGTMCFLTQCPETPHVYEITVSNTNLEANCEETGKKS